MIYDGEPLPEYRIDPPEDDEEDYFGRRRKDRGLFTDHTTEEA